MINYALYYLSGVVGGTAAERLIVSTTNKQEALTVFRGLRDHSIVFSWVTERGKFDGDLSDAFDLEAVASIHEIV